MYYRLKSLVYSKIKSYKKYKLISSFSDEFYNIPELYNPFFVIIMPGGIHVAQLSISLVPEEQDIVVVMNGLDEWEKNWIRNNLHVTWIIEVNGQLEHSEVLNVLFDRIEQNFGILDYDCFVLNNEIFSKLVELDDQTSMNACFLRHNQQLGIDIPETFLLFFNTKLINRFRTEFNVNCEQLRWENIPMSVKESLSTLGLNEAQLPEIHKPYYDTLRVLMLLAMAKNKPYRFIARHPATPVPSGEVFHIGGISNPLEMRGVWAFRGSYFWQRLLEKSVDQELKKYYSRKFNLDSSNELLSKNPKWKEEVGEVFFKFCDKLINY